MTFRGMTLSTITVLLDMRKSAPVGRTGADLMATHNLKSGSVYPILAALKKAGLVTVDKERGNPRKLGRPLRKFYFLSRVGVAVAEDMVETLRRLL